MNGKSLDVESTQVVVDSLGGLNREGIKSRFENLFTEVNLRDLADKYSEIFKMADGRTSEQGENQSGGDFKVLFKGNPYDTTLPYGYFKLIRAVISHEPTEETEGGTQKVDTDDIDALVGDLLTRLLERSATEAFSTFKGLLDELPADSNLRNVDVLKHIMTSLSEEVKRRAEKDVPVESAETIEDLANMVDNSSVFIRLAPLQSIISEKKFSELSGADSKYLDEVRIQYSTVLINATDTMVAISKKAKKLYEELGNEAVRSERELNVVFSQSNVLLDSLKSMKSEDAKKSDQFADTYTIDTKIKDLEENTAWMTSIFS